MRLPQFFIDRPIFAGVLSVIITLVGALALLRLPISEYPEVVPPSIQITAAYPGRQPGDGQCDRGRSARTADDRPEGAALPGLAEHA